MSQFMGYSGNCSMESIRAATNDYFNNRLICRLFFRLIDESDIKKKTL